MSDFSVCRKRAGPSDDSLVCQLHVSTAEADGLAPKVKQTEPVIRLLLCEQGDCYQRLHDSRTQIRFRMSAPYRLVFWLVVLFAALVSVSGCAGSRVSVPSFDKRPIEGLFGVAETTALPLPPSPPSGEIAVRLAHWRADAAATRQVFAEELRLTRTVVSALVAAAASAALPASADASLPASADASLPASADSPSEQWLEAQVSLSRLIAARARVTAALVEIDDLYGERQLGVGESGAVGAVSVAGLPEIYALRGELAAALSDQDQQIALLARQLAEVR